MRPLWFFSVHFIFHSPWVVSCRVSATLAVAFDALLICSDRPAIIQLNLADPLLAVARTVTEEVYLYLA
jgi:hypothetical protein